MDIEIVKSGDQTELLMSGNLTILEAVKIREELVHIAYSTTTASVILDHTKTKEIDLSYLQILIGFSRLMEKMDKVVKINDCDNKLLNQIIELAGIKHLLKNEGGCN